MSILCWNYRELGNVRIIHFLKNLLRVNNNPHILFISETICNKYSMEAIRISLGFSPCFFVERNILSGELALIWYSDLVNLNILSSSMGQIDTKITPSDSTLIWRFNG